MIELVEMLAKAVLTGIGFGIGLKLTHYLIGE